PVENLFCCIRQHGISNTNPTCYQFISALKTCVVNNLEKSINVSSNCENDDNKLLNNLRYFLTSCSSSDNCQGSCTVSSEETERLINLCDKVVNMEDTNA